MNLIVVMFAIPKSCVLVKYKVFTCPLYLLYITCVSFVYKEGKSSCAIKVIELKTHWRCLLSDCSGRTIAADGWCFVDVFVNALSSWTVVSTNCCVDQMSVDDLSCSGGNYIQVVFCWVTVTNNKSCCFLHYIFSFVSYHQAKSRRV